MAAASRASRWSGTAFEGRIMELDAATAPLREAISHHRLTELIGDSTSLRLFMEHHVVAVWDFMSLLTALQRDLTCVRTPWRPVGDPANRRFINELVLTEESDDAPGGGYTSHLELYLEAMKEAGADTAPIMGVLARVEAGQAALTDDCGLPAEAAAFAAATLDTATSAPTHALAATFAFGRERLIPTMFATLREAALRHRPRLDLLLAYLDRHIELDADEHTPLAFNLVTGVCGDDPDRWAEARAAALQALQNRLDLWEAIARAIEGSQPAAAG
jgi:hypothetical protein